MQATQTTMHIRASEIVMVWIARARALATAAHAGQVDKAGQPYIGHVSRVAARGSADPDQYYARIAADPLALKVKRADIADNADEDRLVALDTATAERLRVKYRHALAQLAALPGPPAPSIEH